MSVSKFWSGLGPAFMPFADAVSDDLPAKRLVRLGLFQVTVGMALALLAGTLNRVMIVELGLRAFVVAGFLALPMLLAPMRALLGHRSDHHRSVLGWKRVPYLWFGTMMQFGGFAVLPFALILLDTGAGFTATQRGMGIAGAALGFLLVGAGAHTVQTAGLALASDLSDEKRRPKVVAVLYVAFLVGLLLGGLFFAALLYDYSELRLIKVIQGAAVLTMVLNGIALWKQEALTGESTASADPRPPFLDAWRQLVRTDRTGRLLLAVALGAAGFAMQDVLLEPYGGQLLDMSVGQTSLLTALSAVGALVSFGVAAVRLTRGADEHRIAGWGVVAGIFAFAMIVIAAPLRSAALLRGGAVFLGFGGGLFAVGTLTAAMALQSSGAGLAVGAWGAVQATAAGVAIALGGLVRDVVTVLAEQGALGPAMTGPEAGYIAVYHGEILILFATLVVIGPLVSPRRAPQDASSDSPRSFGFAELPG
jgi:BCD family chlorophyll transporter-like MFS transporter